MYMHIYKLVYIVKQNFPGVLASLFGTSSIHCYFSASYFALLDKEDTEFG